MHDTPIKTFIDAAHDASLQWTGSWQRSEAVRNARTFAMVHHHSQRYGAAPYSVHLADVEAVLMRFGLDNRDLRCAAWLHDVLEDTPVTKEQLQEEFGERVADIVDRVTGRGFNRRERNAYAYPRIRGLFGPTAVKLADRIANVESCLRARDPGLFRMYEREHQSFWDALMVQQMATGAISAMWFYLDGLIKLGREPVAVPQADGCGETA
jgi:guanosine-3',5'-bis(diphosphate) 3'-pyrophosphohydrolase